jgi:uncharacterized protein (DUF1778 family)
MPGMLCCDGKAQWQAQPQENRSRTMSASTDGRGRITARVTAHAQQLIETAAERTAMTTNQFVAQAALREALRVLEEARVIWMSERDASRFFEAIDHPQAINQRLSASLKVHLGAWKDLGSRVSAGRWKPRSPRV